MFISLKIIYNISCTFLKNTLFLTLSSELHKLFLKYPITEGNNNVKIILYNINILIFLFKFNVIQSNWIYVLYSAFVHTDIWKALNGNEILMRFPGIIKRVANDSFKRIAKCYTYLWNISMIAFYFHLLIFDSNENRWWVFFLSEMNSLLKAY